MVVVSHPEKPGLQPSLHKVFIILCRKQCNELLVCFVRTILAVCALIVLLTAVSHEAAARHFVHAGLVSRAYSVRHAHHIPWLGCTAFEIVRVYDVMHMLVNALSGNSFLTQSTWLPNSDTSITCAPCQPQQFLTQVLPQDA